MAAGPTVPIDFDSNAADLAAQIDAALQKVLAKTARDISKVLSQIGNEARKNVSNAATDRQLKASQRSAEELRKSLKAIGDTTSALQGQFGKAFDPRNVAALDDQLRRLAELQQKLKEGAQALGDVEYDRLSTELKAVSTGVIATRESFLVAARAAEEMRRNQERNFRLAGRTAREESRQATSRYVVDAQTQASAARDASRQQIEATKAASRQRVAVIQAAARTIATIERGLRTVFEGTARAVSAAFRGVGTAVSGVATGISSAFRRSSSEVNNNITNSYSKTFKNATNTVRNETNQQQTIIRQFADRATSAIGGIGGGTKLAIGGALAIFGGKALTGGFARATTLEDSQRALTVLLNSAEEAQALQARVLDIVTGTPFRLDQFSAATTQLIAYNVEAEKVPDILTAIADAASVMGSRASESVDRLTRVFGQISASGRLTGEDLLQLTEAGIPALSILGNTLGKTQEEVRDLVTDGLVPAEVAMNALINGITNGTDGINGATAAFGGLAKELGNTLSGALGNFNTAISRFGANLITSFTPLFVAALKAGTAAIDLLGSAFASLAKSIQDTPLFSVLTRGFEALTRASKTAKDELKPLFDFIADGIVVLAQFSAAIATFRRIPAIVSLVGLAFRRLFTPINLLVAAGVIVAGFFQRLIEGSDSLQEAISRVGDVLGGIATVIRDLAFDAFEALSEAVTGVAGPAVESFSDLVKNILGPALSRLAAFLETTVLPAVRRFAETMREDVLPFIGTALAKAITFTQEAFSSLVAFIRDEVIPTVGPILTKAVDIARAAFEKFYGFLSGTLIPFIQANLLPVLASVGTALGVLALSGGNVPLAGLAGITAGVVAVLSDDEIREALVSNIKEAVKEAQAALKNLFSVDTALTIVKGAMKVANEIGRILGDIATDRRLLTAIAGITAAAAAIAAAFVAGLVEGIIDNIPELIDGLTNALTQAFKAIASDPKLATAFVAGIIGAAAIAKLVVSGRKAGKVLAQAVAEGAVTVQGQGGAGARGLLEGLIGGPAAIRQSASRAGQQYGEALTKAIRNEVRVIQNLGGQLPTDPLGLQRVPGESFAAQNERLAQTYKRLTDETGRLGGELGTAAVSGVRLRDGLQQIVSGNIRQGFGQLGTAVKGAGREIGTSAGIVAGAAFAASFVSQALFDAEASGFQKLQAGLGTVAIGAATGAELYGAKGAAIGAGLGLAVTAVGLLTSRVDENEEALKRAAAAADTYKDALDGLTEAADIREAFRGQFRENLRDVESVADALDDAGFKFEQLGEVLSSQRTGGAFFADVKAQLRDAGVEGEQFEETIRFLEDQLKGFRQAVGAETDIQNIFASAGTAAATAALEADIATAATKVFNDEVNRLNDVRIGGLEQKVDDARDALSQAGSAADEAREKVAAFLRGDSVEKGLQTLTDEATIGVANTRRALEELGPGASTAAGEVGAAFRLALDDVALEASNLLANAAPADEASARALLQPLIDEAGGVGTEVGAAITALLDEQLARYSGQTGGKRTKGASFAQGLLAQAQADIDAARTELAKAENALTVGLTVDPLDIPLVVAGAKQALTDAGPDLIAGFAEGFPTDALQSQATDVGNATIDALLSSLGVSSPSTKTREAGVFVAQGFAIGIRAGAGQMVLASREAGIQAMAGLTIGLRAGSSAVYATIRAIGARMVTELRNELKIESPSKVTEEIGEQTVEGFIKGVDDSLPLIDRIAFSAGTYISKEFTSVGERAGQAIGIGFAEQGAGFAGSVAGALDDAFESALSKVDRFKAIGKAIGSAIFASQGTSPLGVVGGGAGAVDLQRAFIEILGNTDRFQQAVQKQVDQFGFYGLDFNLTSAIGQQNQSAFLEAGTNIREYGETLLEGGRSAESAVGEMRVYRDQLINLASSWGVSNETLSGLINTLGLSDAQLNQFVATVRATEAAAAAAAAEAERAIANQVAAEEQARLREAAERAAEDAARAAEQAWEDAARAAEQAAQDAADRAREEEERRRREYTFQQPVFRDLIIQSPSGDPEAVALAAANRVAFSIRR